MTKKYKSKLPARGGLKALAQENKPTTKKNKKTKAASKRFDQIFGFAPTAVIRALGQNGVSLIDARAIIAAKGIKMPQKSIDVQVSLGRTKARPVAALTKEQVQELKALVPEPAAAE